MPAVFKISIFILITALIGGILINKESASPGANQRALTMRANCPSMGGPEKIVTRGDEIRVRDAFQLRQIGGIVGLHDGCAR